jgi:hypothetical protein
VREAQKTRLTEEARPQQLVQVHSRYRYKTEGTHPKGKAVLMGQKAGAHAPGDLAFQVRTNTTLQLHRRARKWLTCLGLLRGHPAHVLGVQLYRVVAKLGLGSSLEVMTSDRKVAVPLHPPGKRRRINVRDDTNTKASKRLTSRPHGACLQITKEMLGHPPGPSPYLHL